MELYPNRSEPEAHIAVLQRFTAEVKFRWSRLVFCAAIGENELVNRVNALIYEEFGAPRPGVPVPARSQMDLDIGGATPKPIYGARGPSGSEAWTPGGGGFHEARATIYGNISSNTTSPYPVPWTFTTKIGSNPNAVVTMNVVVRWFEEDINV